MNPWVSNPSLNPSASARDGSETIDGSKIASTVEIGKGIVARKGGVPVAATCEIVDGAETASTFETFDGAKYSSPAATTCETVDGAEFASTFKTFDGAMDPGRAVGL
jgi:hypothetical protein